MADTTRRLSLKHLKGNFPVRWGIAKKESFFDRKIKLVFNKNFGFAPQNLQHYREALRHRSALDHRNNSELKSNERLEFLGDSLLGAYTAALLFKQYPHADEGFLTKLRSKIVSRNHLNKLACDLQINQLVKNALASGQETNTIYGNALEAVFGAIYLEKGLLFLNKIFQNIFERHIDLKVVENTETDYKSKLFEFSQKEKKALNFTLVKEEMVHNRKQYTIEVSLSQGHVATGTGSSKKKAEQDAARKLLEMLNLS